MSLFERLLGKPGKKEIFREEMATYINGCIEDLNADVLQTIDDSIGGLGYEEYITRKNRLLESTSDPVRRHELSVFLDVRKSNVDGRVRGI